MQLTHPLVQGSAHGGGVSLVPEVLQSETPQHASDATAISYAPVEKYQEERAAGALNEIHEGSVPMYIKNIPYIDAISPDERRVRELPSVLAYG